ncbi:MAG: hypothetical protein ACI95C_002273, partial [Pseudohongiellaceae bacterium]
SETRKKCRALNPKVSPLKLLNYECPLKITLALKQCDPAKLSAVPLNSLLFLAADLLSNLQKSPPLSHPASYRVLFQNTGISCACIFVRVRTAQSGWINERKPVLPNGPATSKDNDHKVIATITM